MKAVVNDKNHLTFVSHLNGVTIVESGGFIIDLDYQCLTSICEIEEIEQLKSDIIKLQADIANFQACVANVSDIEYELNKCRETNNALTEKLESKTSDLAERTYWSRYYRRAFRVVKPNEKYGLDSSGYNIVNSIDSKFIISFKDTSITSKAFNELRYSISPRTVLLKYENDIVE